MLPDDVFPDRRPFPSEAESIIEAERRGMTVPVWTLDPTPSAVFVRKDGVALLVVAYTFGEPCAFVCPSVERATVGWSWDPEPGYGVIPYPAERAFLPGLLDAFQRWDGDDALAELLARR